MIEQRNEYRPRLSRSRTLRSVATVGCAIVALSAPSPSRAAGEPQRHCVQYEEKTLCVEERVEGSVGVTDLEVLSMDGFAATASFNWDIKTGHVLEATDSSGTVYFEYESSAPDAHPTFAYLEPARGGEASSVQFDRAGRLLGVHTTTASREYKYLSSGQLASISLFNYLAPGDEPEAVLHYRHGPDGDIQHISLSGTQMRDSMREVANVEPSILKTGEPIPVLRSQLSGPPSPGEELPLDALTWDSFAKGLSKGAKQLAHGAALFQDRLSTAVLIYAANHTNPGPDAPVLAKVRNTIWNIASFNTLNRQNKLVAQYKGGELSSREYMLKSGLNGLAGLGTLAITVGTGGAAYYGLAGTTGWVTVVGGASMGAIEGGVVWGADATANLLLVGERPTTEGAIVSLGLGGVLGGGGGALEGFLKSLSTRQSVRLVLSADDADAGMRLDMLDFELIDGSTFVDRPITVLVDDAANCPQAESVFSEFVPSCLLDDGVEEFSPDAWWWDVFVHSDGESVTLPVVGGKQKIQVDDPAVFVTVLNAFGWDGRPIRLFACYTGLPNNFGQKLATYLKQPIKAPNHKVSVGADGTIKVGPHVETNNGEFVIEDSGWMEILQ